MLPQNNTTVERELPAWLPSGTTIEVVRIPRGPQLLTPEVMPAYRSHCLQLAQAFAEDRIDVVAYSCTAASFLLGPEVERELGSELEKVTSKPVVTIARAVVGSLSRLGVTRIGVVSPYTDSVNERLREMLSEAGISVVAINTFTARDVTQLSQISALDVLRLSRRTMTDDCEALCIACAQLPTLGVTDTLASEFCRPVVSSLQSLASELSMVVGAR
ncbi:aspartate/glutamate racemase family protein [Streptomyces sp. 5-6(2022)]|uniref:maleate cis-trans isomerase family protein n=1 Tax=Streptomyces sp. 5-6(2022) TaxID=2936510 RepID=UPI0023BA0987|nr:aspartate/glutamate racemase family protein [Streptomyces sp. 5-6(2022)]